MKTYTWTTEKGAKVEIEVKKTKIEKDCGYGVKKDGGILTTIESMKVNGKDIGQAGFNGDSFIEFHIGNQRALAPVPEEIQEQIFGEERRAAEARREAEAKAEREYQEHYNKVRRAMEE